MPGLFVEPPGPRLSGRRSRSLSSPRAGNAAGLPPWLRLGAGVAATALVVASTGDLLLLALALAAVIGSQAAVGGVLACLSVAVRTGAVSLASVAGAQAVLGPAGLVGPPLQAAGAWAAGAALLVTTPAGPAAVPLGLAAGFIVAGPTVASFGDVVVRLAGAVAGVAVAAGMGRLPAERLPSRARVLMAAGLGALAFALAVAS